MVRQQVCVVRQGGGVGSAMTTLDKKARFGIVLGPGLGLAPGLLYAGGVHGMQGQRGRLAPGLIGGSRGYCDGHCAVVRVMGYGCGPEIAWMIRIWSG